MSTHRAPRNRWRSVNWLSHLPRVCISDLVEWAQADTEDRRRRHPLTAAFGTKQCRQDRDRIGGCYCGRYQDAGRSKRDADALDAGNGYLASDDPWAGTEAAS